MCNMFYLYMQVYKSIDNLLDRQLLCNRCWARWQDRIPLVWPEPDHRWWCGQVSIGRGSAGTEIGMMMKRPVVVCLKIHLKINSRLRHPETSTTLFFKSSGSCGCSPMCKSYAAFQIGLESATGIFDLIIKIKGFERTYQNQITPVKKALSVVVLVSWL